MAKRMIVFSFDALGGIDYSYLKTKPEFKQFFEKAAYCTNVSSVYPSVTYVCHTSIVTGRLPKNHGICANTLLQSNRIDSPDWYWQRKYVKGTTIYDEAKAAKKTVAAFLWPVTAKANIDYILPEIFPNRIWDNQVLTTLRNGSPLFVLNLFAKYRHLLNGIAQPNLDDFVTEAVIDTINSKAPELMLIHLTDLDTQRHNYGVFSEEAYEALDRHARRFQKIVNALKDNNLYDETVIVVLGDHFQKDFQHKIPINQLLFKQFPLQLRHDQVKEWSVLAKSNGGSAYIYTKDKWVENGKLQAVLEQLKAQPHMGIEKIYTGAEAAAMGADPNCAFMLEAKEGYVFIDFRGGGDKGTKADHGYHPTNKQDYATFYAMSGPGVKACAHVPSMSLIDIAPTWAKLLNLTLEETDGNAIVQMLEGCEIDG